MSRLPISAFSGLEQRLLASIRTLDLDGSTIGLAFSGGNDSLSLAIALSRVGSRAGLKTTLIHVDHQLRRESASDALRCRELAGQLGLPLVMTRLPPHLRQRASGVGVEEQARRERYCALTDECRSIGASLLATAHHLDDQAETILMHLFRGSGLRGAAGMRVLQDLGDFGQELVLSHDSEPSLQIWRPFLREHKATLRRYVEGFGLQPVEDATNAILDIHRNVVRHEILPLIERSWPGAVKAFGRFGAVSQLDDDYLTRDARELGKFAITDEGALDVNLVHTIEPPLAHRIVYGWLASGGVEQPTLDRIEAVVLLANQPSELSMIEVGSNRLVVRFGQLLRVGTREELVKHALRTVPGPACPFPDGATAFAVPEAVGHWLASAPEWSIGFSVAARRPRCDGPNEAHAVLGVEGWIEPESISVRRVQRGDRWADSGLPVRDSLRRAGVHPLVRRSVVCLATGKGVLFIPNIPQPTQVSQLDVEPEAWLSVWWTKREPPA